MVKINDFRQKGSIKDLLRSEKEDYFEYLQFTYKDNLNASEFNLIKFPRWSIISGYYAMHDLAKLFLGKKFELKLSSPNVHAATIQALRELVKRKDIIKYMEEAESYFELHRSLIKGREEREKTQYYSLNKANINIQRATYFFENIVLPFVKILEGMIDDI